jgi:DNA-binding CsgD family transcriptional regulator
VGAAGGEPFGDQVALGDVGLLSGVSGKACRNTCAVWRIPSRSGAKPGNGPWLTNPGAKQRSTASSSPLVNKASMNSATNALLLVASDIGVSSPELPVALAAGQGDRRGCRAGGRCQESGVLPGSVVDGARLDGHRQARVSVIIEPPRPDDLAPLLVAAYGLSDREQAVTTLVFQGRSTRQIARALQISPYTVQEHLTAVFDKVGVRSRGNWSGRSSSATACQQSPTDQPAQATNV